MIHFEYRIDGCQFTLGSLRKIDGSDILENEFCTCSENRPLASVYPSSRTSSGSGPELIYIIIIKDNDHIASNANFFINWIGTYTNYNIMAVVSILRLIHFHINNLIQT